MTDLETPPAALDDAPELPDWLSEFRSRVTAEDWGEIVSKLIERAKNGDMKAVEIVERAVLPKDRPDATLNKVKLVRLVLVEAKP